MTRTRNSRAAALASRIAALVVVGLIAGCPHEEYSIELTPQGDLMQRQLTVWHAEGRDDDVPDETLDAISEHYGRLVTAAPQRGYVFAGEFTGAMPNDVGGAGQYATITSRMGYCSTYIERFRGNDSPAQRIQAAFDTADELTDILIGWLEGKLGEQEDFPKLQTFMDEQFRNDLKDLSVYFFLMSSASSTQWAEDNSAGQLRGEILARMVQFLMERQYALPTEVPGLIRALATSASENEGLFPPLEPFIINVLQRKAGMDDEDTLAAVHTMFADPQATGESLAAYVGATEAYQQYLADMPGGSDEQAFMEYTVGRLVMLPSNLGDATDVANVVLKDVSEPMATNGLWDSEAGTVSWRNEIPEYGLPAICYALWGEPDEEFQTQHFGKVLLDGGDLRKYCLWRASLTEQEAAEWDAMIDQYQPDDDESLAMLKEFRFSDEPVHEPEPDEVALPSFSQGMISMLVTNIMGDEGDAPAE